jgi:hypothetical protein
MDILKLISKWVYINDVDINDAIDDIRLEGSGLLMLKCESKKDMDDTIKELRDRDRYIYNSNTDTMEIILVVDVNDIHVIESDPDNCKCINCESERSELSETVCDNNCGCINCNSISLV